MQVFLDKPSSASRTPRSLSRVTLCFPVTGAVYLCVSYTPVILCFRPVEHMKTVTALPPAPCAILLREHLWQMQPLRDGPTVA